MKHRAWGVTGTPPMVAIILTARARTPARAHEIRSGRTPLSPCPPPTKSTLSQPLYSTRSSLSDLTSCAQDPRGITRVAASVDTLPRGTLRHREGLGGAQVGFTSPLSKSSQDSAGSLRSGTVLPKKI